MKNKVNLLFAVVLALVSPIIPALLLFAALIKPEPISDLPEYYAAVDMIKNGSGSLIYVWEKLGHAEHALFPAMGDRIVGLFVPPPAVPLLMPLSWVPLNHAFLFWTLLLLAALQAALLVLKRGFALSPTQVLMVWSVLSISGPAYESLRLGQLAPLLLLAFSLGWVLLKQGAFGMAAVPLSILILKPQELMPFAVFLLGVGKYRTLAVIAVIGGLLTAVAFGLIGMDGFHNYSDLMNYSMNVDTKGMQPELSPTLRGQLLRIWPGQLGVINMISTALFGLSLLAIFYLGFKYRDGNAGKDAGAPVRPGWLAAGLIGAMPLGLVSSLHCHDYDLLLLLPTLLAFATTSAGNNLPPWMKPIALLAAPLFLLPVYIFVHYNGLLSGMVINPLFIALLIFSIVSYWSALQLQNQDEVKP